PSSSFSSSTSFSSPFLLHNPPLATGDNPSLDSSCMPPPRPDATLSLVTVARRGS
ncbi:hypothetical protein PanWU01x14_284110, partial [Parasponia andersonii]